MQAQNRPLWPPPSGRSAKANCRHTRRVLAVRGIPGAITRRCGVPESAGGGAHPAVGIARALLAAGNLAKLRVHGPTESPQVRVSGAVPHRIPTDKTAFPGTRRHGC